MFSSSPHLDDEERLRVLVMMSAQELANGISYSGHMYAMTRAGRHLTPAGDLQETFGGMEQVPYYDICMVVMSVLHNVHDAQTEDYMDLLRFKQQ